MASLFTAVVLGVLDEAVATARSQLGPKADTLRPYERVEWAGPSRTTGSPPRRSRARCARSSPATTPRAFHAALRAKEAVAELAEATLLRITRVLGGGTFSRRSPFAHWFEDVRALGFLRPPWGLAYDGLFATSFG